MPCGGCEATCENQKPMCTRACKPGCACPRKAPIFHNGQCITADECPGMFVIAFRLALSPSIIFVIYSPPTPPPTTTTTLF